MAMALGLEDISAGLSLGSVAAAELAKHRINAAPQQRGNAGSDLPCTPRPLPAVEDADRKNITSGR